MKNPAFHLQHMLACIDRIEQTACAGYEAVVASYEKTDSILLNLQHVAQTSLKLPDAMKARHPEVDWRAIHGFRNILVHDYLSIRFERVWNETLPVALPILKAAARKLLESCESSTP